MILIDFSKLNRKMYKVFLKEKKNTSNVNTKVYKHIKKYDFIFKCV